MSKKEEYEIFSPDGFPIEREGTYKSMAEVQEAIEKFVKKYETQGYYYTSKRERIPLNEIENYCKLIPLHE